MWSAITDCGKQLTIHSRIRETSGDQTSLYEIIEIEFDQYKLQLVERDNLLTIENLQQTLNCGQLLEFGFEVETSEKA